MKNQENCPHHGTNIGPRSLQDDLQIVLKCICLSKQFGDAFCVVFGSILVIFWVPKWSQKANPRACSKSGPPPKTVNSSKAAPRRSKAPQIRPKRRPSLSKRTPQRRPSLSKSFQKCFKMKPNDSQAHVQRSQERFIITRRQHYNEAAPKSFTLRVSARSRRLNNGRCQYSIQKASQKNMSRRSPPSIQKVYESVPKHVQKSRREQDKGKRLGKQKQKRNRWNDEKVSRRGGRCCTVDGLPPASS